MKDFTFATGNEGWKFFRHCPLGLLLVNVGRRRGTGLVNKEIEVIEKGFFENGAEARS